MNQDCACPCGASHFTVAGDPIERFICHCMICQKAYGKPFADVTLFWAVSVALPTGPSIRFRRHRAPPAMRRGSCASCGSPVINLLGAPRSFALAFIPSQNFPQSAELPQPSAHIFYDRRVADIPGGVSKFYGYWASETHVTRAVLGAFFRQKRAA